MRKLMIISALVFGSIGLAGCGDADSARIGAECTTSESCDNDQLTCLTTFKGGYCGASGCASNADCITGSICVTHEGSNYCFRTCTDKPECNANRTVDNESNCSSSITRVEAGNEKVCIPPSSGT